MERSCEQIRKEFIEFFEKKAHAFVPSSSLLPADDPTLLFTNAGMNQYKDVFLGREKRDYVRAANTQKCIRAGGKHNDLEDVGHDTYHHTFFEMLGNWSFGDYFKKEAIEWAWELLTDVWGLPKDRLHVTVFEGDKADGIEPDLKAKELWAKVTDIDPTHIHLGNKKDNFWEMGETGPCGPCSEIHIDLTEDKSGAALVNAGVASVIEIWNLVFIQYNRSAEGKLSPLPAKHVDTGMGLERVGAVLQGKKSNYATDLFVAIIKAIEKLTDHRYGAKSGLEDRFDSLDTQNIGDVACRVIADHARSLTFALADGIIPSNEGRGYVVRRILRRAARYGRQYLNIDGPFLIKIVPTIVDLMGDFFGEIKDNQDYIIETVREEEESFGRTLDRGIELFQRQADKLDKAGKKELPGDVAFDLYATYGFPVDLTQIMAQECGMKVDLDGFDTEMARHRELSSGGETLKVEAIANLPASDDSAKYSLEPIEAKVLGWVVDSSFIEAAALNVGDEAAIVLDKTNFYCEQGGQVGDAGHLLWADGKFAVRDTQKCGDAVLHLGVVEDGILHTGQSVNCEVDASRTDTMRNHSATHLLNKALRNVLGDHVKQAGSIVAPDKLRFDFTHNRAVAPEQIVEIERQVNEAVLADLPIGSNVIPLGDAKKLPDIQAVFGEKYPDPVRVMSFGTQDPQKSPEEIFCVEFCGGTHLQRTSQVGLFKIISEESVAKGVRRITALTGKAAVEHIQQIDEIVRSTSAALRVPAQEVPDRIIVLQKEVKQLRKRPPGQAGGGEFQPEYTVDTPVGKVLIGQLGHADAKAMRSICDQQRQKGAAAMLIGGAEGEKVTLIAMVTDEVAKQGKLKAGDWVKTAAVIVGGSGGGKPTMAQAGGKDAGKLPDALKAAEQFVKEKLS